MTSSSSSTNPVRMLQVENRKCSLCGVTLIARISRSYQNLGKIYYKSEAHPRRGRYFSWWDEYPTGSQQSSRNSNEDEYILDEDKLGGWISRLEDRMIAHANLSKLLLILCFFNIICILVVLSYL